MASTGTAPAQPARDPRGLRRTTIEDAPSAVLSCILEHARGGSKGERFLMYATVSRSWLHASEESVVRTLYLRGQEVDAAVPGAGIDFEGLRRVFLSGYQGETLPAGLSSRLRRVESLQIKDCPNLQSLPGSIGEMASLKKLSLHSLGRLQSLPSSMLRLTALESLAICNCRQFKKVPSKILSALTSLKHLNIHIQIRQIPSSIQNLTQLESLRMISRGMVTEPVITSEGIYDAAFPTIRGLTNLKRLSVSELDSRPYLEDATLGRWEHRPTAWAPLSRTLTTLQHLERLDLSACFTRGAPELLGSLPNLRFLYLRCEDLTSLPPGFPCLNTLKVEIHYDVAGYFEELARYDDYSCEHEDPYPDFPKYFDRLPPGSYPSLKHLSIASEELNVLPQTFFELTTLESLDICAASLREVPAAIGKLVGLRALRLSKCRALDNISEQLTSIRSLEFLTCSGTLRQVPLSPAWSLKLLDVRGVPGLLEVKCPGGCVAVNELRMTCDHASDRIVWPSEIFAGTVFKGLQVLKVAHCGRGTSSAGSSSSRARVGGGLGIVQPMEGGFLGRCPAWQTFECWTCRRRPASSTSPTAPALPV